MHYLFHVYTVIVHSIFLEYAGYIEVIHHFLRAAAKNSNKGICILRLGLPYIILIISQRYES